MRRIYKNVVGQFLIRSMLSLSNKIFTLENLVLLLMHILHGMPLLSTGTTRPTQPNKAFRPKHAIATTRANGRTRGGCLGKLGEL